jgi:surface protein
MKTTIVTKNKEHLKLLIQIKINKNGLECDLNHIDVSNIKDMNWLFYISEFNGDISKWDVSNVNSMEGIFSNSKFNGDISKWNTSKVKSMREMFKGTKFNGDINNWDVSNVNNMEEMFSYSHFNGDLSNWKPINVEKIEEIFYQCPSPIPYWARFENIEDRIKAINNFWLAKDLQEDLSNNKVQAKKPKI